MLTEEIRKEIRARLEAAFHERLQGVLLFGSEARREARPDSDLNLMVLLEGPVRLGKDLETIIWALYPVQLDLDAPIHALPVAGQSFMAGGYSLYRSAKREGIPL
jgi:predicted nucleotidyltransferase